MLSMDRWKHFTVSTTIAFLMTAFISSCQCYVVTVIIIITFVTFIVTSMCIVWFIGLHLSLVVNVMLLLKSLLSHLLFLLSHQGALFGSLALFLSLVLNVMLLWKSLHYHICYCHYPIIVNCLVH